MSILSIKDLNDIEVVDLARNDKIDIAVDLMGYIQNNRISIFSYRVAPIQINYLGYPGTLGADVMDYITMGSTGNATDFGDLTVARMNLASASNATRGLFAGGLKYPSNSNVIDYITIGSTGNAQDFGDLTRAQDGTFGASSSNPSQGS